MSQPHAPVRTFTTIAYVLLALVAGFSSLEGRTQTVALRPMTFLDVQLMNQPGAPTPSPDGRWLLYTVSFPDWREARRQTDLFLVSMADGVASTKQMTFTTDKNETAPAWTRDGRSFLFLSNRDAPPAAATQGQIYQMRLDGGEARRLTDAKDGVADFEVSRDGRWIYYRAGRAEGRQLFRISTQPSAERLPAPETLTRQPAGIEAWTLPAAGTRVYFTTADRLDADEKARRDARFTVNIRNAETPAHGLWVLDLDPVTTRRLSPEGEYSVSGVTVSADGKWVGFRGGSVKRYERNITQEGLYSDVYLLEVSSGRIERLTNNAEVGESGPSFSPDSQWVAFGAPDDTSRYTMTNGRVYVRAVGDRGKPFRKLDGGFDGDLSVGFWSADSTTIYFNTGLKATTQLFALDVSQNEIRQVTRESASLSVSRDDDSGAVLVNYADGTTPPTLFAVPSLDRVGTRSTWTQLTDVNPQIRTLALGTQEEITWTSKDGTRVGGVLHKPVGYQQGQRYPLIVAIHGGPASADVLNFNGGYGAQVYAGAGYVVLRPNYRGSTNYGFTHKTGIVGDYFRAGYEDIMAGVDHLIAQGLVDGNQMGVLGWSAGGHWSNWILTQTDRFKAISSGAGTSNWISMYAQSDVQRNRQFYLGDKLPYDDHDAYWNQSPLKYIRNAKTPTMIHVVEGDPRVPSPQSVELHMALKQIGVPTELFMYPGTTHGIPDARNQFVKSVSEMAWMDYYVRGKGERFSWRDVLTSVEKAK